MTRRWYQRLVGKARKVGGGESSGQELCVIIAGRRAIRLAGVRKRDEPEGEEKERNDKGHTPRRCKKARPAQFSLGSAEDRQLRPWELIAGEGKQVGGKLSQ